MRLYGGDIISLRSEHLGNLAHLTNCNPICVDALFVRDFFQLVLFIEATIKAQQKRDS